MIYGDILASLICNTLQVMTVAITEIIYEAM